jgi:hypothetical protein
MAGRRKAPGHFFWRLRLRPCEPEACEAEGEHQRQFALGVGPQRKQQK